MAYHILSHAMSVPVTLSEQAAAVRGFNRFYTRQIGVLDEGLLDSPFSLTQARVLFELGTRKAVTAGEIGEALGLDAGYLSRIVQNFTSQALIQRAPSSLDGRQIVLSLTPAGKNAFRKLDRKSHGIAAANLSRLSVQRRERLLASMPDIQRMLPPDNDDSTGTGTVRTPRMGELGWAIRGPGRL